MNFNTDGYNPPPTSLSMVDVLWLIFSLCYCFPDILFLDDTLLNVYEVVTFPSSSIIITSKTPQSIITFLEGKFYKDIL